MRSVRDAATMNERRYFLFLILSTAIIFATPAVIRFIWPVPPNAAQKKAQPKPAAKEAAPREPAAQGPAAPKAAQVTEPPPQSESDQQRQIPVHPPIRLGSDQPDSPYLMQVELSNLGAAVTKVVLNRFQNEAQSGPLQLLADTEPPGPWHTVTGIPFGSFALEVPEWHEQLVRRAWEVDGPAPVRDEAGREVGVRVTFRRRLKHAPIAISKTYTLYKGQYALDLELSFKNVGSSKQTVTYWLYGPRGIVLEGWWYAWLKREVALAVVREGASKRGTHVASKLAKACRKVAERIAQIDANGDGRVTRNEWIEAVTDPWPEEFDLDGNNTLGPSETLLYVHVMAGRDLRWDLLERVDFAGAETQYFCALIVPQNTAAQAAHELWPVVNTLYVNHPELSDVGILLRSRELELEAGKLLRHHYRIYAGPRDEGVFAAAIGRADLAGYVTNYGMFSGIARIMLAILKFFHRIVPNWGVAIILLTVVVRLAMHPLTRRQIIMSQRMQQKMATLKPELDKLKEKYKGDREALGRATLELYRKHGVNPLAPLQGCLPLLLQMPIFIGLWRALSSAVELRQAPFLLWIDNLAAPDMLFPFGFSLPILGPYFNLLPVLSLVLMYFQQKWMTPPSPDPEIQAQQRMTMIMMTIFTLLIFYKLPSGLCLYFLASTAWGLAERKLIPKIEHLEEEPKKTREPAPAKARRRAQRPDDAEQGRFVEKIKRSSLGRKLMEIIEQAEKK